MSTPGGPAAPQGTADPRRLAVGVLVALLVGLAVATLIAHYASPSEVDYTRFRAEVRAGNVERVTMQGTRVSGRFTEAIGGEGGDVEEFVTRVPALGDDTLLPLLSENGVAVTVRPDTSLGSWLLQALPFVVLAWLVLGLLSARRAQGRGLLDIGRSSARLASDKEVARFDDVAGAEGARAELRQMVDFLREPARFHRIGGKPPRGLLLVGPPGTGKTLLARATAGEAGVPFFHLSGSDFMEMFVGVGAARVRDLFQSARRRAPAIVFIDELDSIGRRRGTGLGGGHDEREQTLNRLLSELDGFEPSEGVIVMAATNRPDVLDPALLRPGRFDRQVSVDLPGLDGRHAILEIHARSRAIADDVDLRALARSLPGFSGADLANLLNEAALRAASAGHEVVRPEDVEAARDKVLLGLERKGLRLGLDEWRVLAYHESGHAVVAALLPDADPLHKVSIVPRGSALGGTHQIPSGERYVYPAGYLQQRLAVLMGGRAAEELALGTVTSGSESDLKEAVRLCRRMVLDWGMSEKLGPLALGGEREMVFLGEEIAQRRQYSEQTARDVDEEVRALVDAAYQRARRLLEAHRAGLDALAEALLEHEELPGHRVDELLGRGDPASQRREGADVTEMSIHRDDAAGRYVGRLPDGSEAVLEFENVDASVIELVSTFVPESHRGGGQGRRLVRHAFDDAASQGLKVIPTCPFVSRVLAESPEYQELVVGARARA